MKEQLFVPGYGFNEILLTHTRKEKKKKKDLLITTSETPLFLYLLGTSKLRNVIPSPPFLPPPSLPS